MATTSNDISLSDGLSISGIYGRHDLSGVNGWEQNTTAIGGSVDIRLGHAQGVPSYDHNTVSVDEPLRLGRFIGVWLRTPPFFNDAVRKYWFYFFQDKVLEVTGLQDNEIDVMTRNMGAVKREESYAGAYKENNGKFTLKIPEVKGSPVGKIMKYYITGISDSVTGTAHFHGNSNLRFSKVNYGGDFLYILLGPTMRPDDIEFSCLWVNAFPQTDYIGHMNSGAIGEYGSADLAWDINFNGSYIQNDEINRLAQIITEAVGLYKDTSEDVILPSYIYDNIVNNVTSLPGLYGADLDTKLANANTAAGNVTNQEIPDIIAGRSVTQGTNTMDITVKPASTSNNPLSVTVAPTAVDQQ